jgi:hypothetical protein
MDRHDERKLESDVDEVVTPENPRPGDVLGVGSIAVPKEPSDHRESAAERRERVKAAEERERDLKRGRGATGIDMGSGGSGSGR